MSLLNVIQALAGTLKSPPEWQAARQRIIVERALVEELMSDRQVRIYGFNTYLGHEDHLDAHDPEQFGFMLRNHLVGAQHSIPPSLVRALAAAKAEQLSRGGTGIPVEVYDQIVASAAHYSDEPMGAWSSSYGCGDVVPAAWLASAIIEPAWLERPGALIAAINGSFYSAAIGGVALIYATHVVANTLHCMDKCAEEIRARSDPLAPQLPVSFRDHSSLVESVTAAIDDLNAAVSSRLSRPSGNPLFDFRSDATVPLSQNSFLDHGLTVSLTRMIQSLHILSSYCHSSISFFVSYGAKIHGPGTRSIQVPKVSRALVERMQLSFGSMPSAFGGSDSEGIEDVRDLALLAALQVIGAASLCADHGKLLRSTIGCTHDEYRTSYLLAAPRLGLEVLSEADWSSALDGAAESIDALQQLRTC